MLLNEAHYLNYWDKPDKWSKSCFHGEILKACVKTSSNLGKQARLRRVHVQPQSGLRCDFCLTTSAQVCCMWEDMGINEALNNWIWDERASVRPSSHPSSMFRFLLLLCFISSLSRLCEFLDISRYPCCSSFCLHVSSCIQLIISTFFALCFPSSFSSSSSLSYVRH